MIWRYLVEGPWIVFGAYWAAGALKTRRTVSQESLASRCGFLFLEILGFVLLFSDVAEIGVLGHRVVHQTYALAVTGVALTWIGIAVALWARWHLGQYWSARVTLKRTTSSSVLGPTLISGIPFIPESIWQRWAELRRLTDGDASRESAWSSWAIG